MVVPAPNIRVLRERVSKTSLGGKFEKEIDNILNKLLNGEDVNKLIESYESLKKRYLAVSRIPPDERRRLSEKMFILGTILYAVRDGKLSVNTVKNTLNSEPRQTASTTSKTPRTITPTPQVPAVSPEEFARAFMDFMTEVTDGIRELRSKISNMERDILDLRREVLGLQRTLMELSIKLERLSGGKQ